mgnify:CR=1 FL=1
MKALDNEESQVSLKLDYYNSLKYYLDNKEQIKDLVAYLLDPASPVTR